MLLAKVLAIVYLILYMIGVRGVAIKEYPLILIFMFLLLGIGDGVWGIYKELEKLNESRDE